MKYGYLTRCTDIHPSDLPALQEMIAQEKPISFGAFMRHVWRSQMVQLFPGYIWEPYDRGRGLRMRDDFCVSYYRSTWKGQRCYFVRWSGIEHVFL